jgi:integrase
MITFIITQSRHGQSELVNSYLSELARRGRGSHTVRAYRTDLAVYVDYLQKTGRPANAPSASDYIVSLTALAPASLARRRAAIRGWLGWMADGGRPVGRVDLVRSVHVERSKKTTPSRADVQAALAQIPLQAESEQLFFGLLATLGLRPGEALALSLEDFFEGEEALYVPGWGGRRRRVLIADATMLMRLVNRRRTSGRSLGPMFLGPRGGPLRYQTMATRWKEYEAAAGVSVALGDLRLGHAIELLDAGVPEWVVRDRLGQHSGPLPRRSRGPAQADEMLRAWRAAKDGAASGGAASPDQDQDERRESVDGSATA